MTSHSPKRGCSTTKHPGHYYVKRYVMSRILYYSLDYCTLYRPILILNRLLQRFRQHRLIGKLWDISLFTAKCEVPRLLGNSPIFITSLGHSSLFSAISLLWLWDVSHLAGLVLRHGKDFTLSDDISYCMAADLIQIFWQLFI